MQVHPLNHDLWDRVRDLRTYLSAQQWTLKVVAREYGRIIIDELYGSVHCRQDTAAVQRRRSIADDQREVDCSAFTSDCAQTSSTSW